MAAPLRGEIWMLNLNPTRGREQRGRRPALVLSTNQFNKGPADLVVVPPMTSTDRGIPLHIRIDTPEGGINKTSYVKCEDIRSVSKERFSKRWGMVSRDTMREVEDRLRILLEI